MATREIKSFHGVQMITTNWAVVKAPTVRELWGLRRLCTCLCACKLQVLLVAGSIHFSRPLKVTFSHGEVDVMVNWDWDLIL